MKKLNKLLILTALVFSTFALSAHEDNYLPLSTKSEEAKAAFHQALNFLWNSRMDEYRAKLDEALKSDPQFFAVHAHIAIAEYSFDNKEKSKEFAEKTLALNQDNLTPAEKILREIVVNLKDDNTKELKSLCDQMIETYPDNPQAYELAMAVNGKILDNRDAEARYAQRLVEIDPTQGPAWNQLGYYYMEKNDMEKAKQAFENYIKNNPDEANAHDSMADYYMKEGKYDDAVTHYEKAVAMGMEISRERAEKARSLARGEGVEEDIDKE